MSEDAQMEDVAPPAPAAEDSEAAGGDAAAAAPAPAPEAAASTETSDTTGDKAEAEAEATTAGTAPADAPTEPKEGGDAQASAEGAAGGDDGAKDAAAAADATDGGETATSAPAEPSEAPCGSAEDKSDAPADAGGGAVQKEASAAEAAPSSDNKQEPASSAADVPAASSSAADATTAPAAKAPAPATSVPAGMVTAAEAAAQMSQKRKAQQEAAAAAAAEAKAAKKRASSKSPTGGAGGEEPKKKKAKKKKKKGEEFGVSGRRLPTAATRPDGPAGSGKKTKKPKPGSLADSGSAPYSAAQTAVNEMMRKALEEDQYSALGSIVDTDSDDDDVGTVAKSTVIADTASIPAPTGGAGADASSKGARTSPVPAHSSAAGAASTAVRLDRTMLHAAMRKRLRIEEQKAGPRTITDDIYLSGDEDEYGTDADDDMSGGGSAPGSRRGSPTPSDASKRRARRGSRPGTDSDDEGAASAKSGTGDADAVGGLGGEDDDLMDEFEEASIFGATAGSSNATWVECDKCKKWRRLRGVVDAKKLPSKWYCHMNKGDPERAKCSAPEEEYETPATPESLQDMRTRKHLRLWVRRLQCNEAYESRLPTMTTRGKKRSTTTSAKEPYEWVRCCNPSCGKWRALLRFMDASTVMEQCKNGEWYCVLNTWDEKAASCAAPQENLPAIGCPPWVMQNDDV